MSFPDPAKSSPDSDLEQQMEYLRKGTLQRYAQVLLATNEEIFR